jgi:hypothetical protein
MQWLQDPNQSSVGNLNHLKCEDSRHFRNKKKEYLKAKIDVLVTNSKVKNITDLYWGIIDLKKVYQPRTKIVMDEKGDFVTGSHSISATWRNHFSQLLNVHMISDVRHPEIHAAEPQVPEPSAFEVEMAIEKLRGHKSPAIDQIPAELIKAGGRTICSESRKHILFGVRRNCLRRGRSRSLYLTIRRAIKQIVLIIETCHFYLLIAETIGISKKCVGHILHEELDMKKLCARWVPHLLTENQKRTRMKISERCLGRFNKNETDFVRPFISMDHTTHQNPNSS